MIFTGLAGITLGVRARTSSSGPITSLVQSSISSNKTVIEVPDISLATLPSLPFKAAHTSFDAYDEYLHVQSLETATYATVPGPNPFNGWDITYTLPAGVAIRGAVVLNNNTTTPVANMTFNSTGYSVNVNGLACTAGKGFSLRASLAITGEDNSLVADQLYGGSGADVISGRGGNDLVDGKKGIDTLTGGAGIDTFQFSSFGTDNADSITDFSSTDRIMLDNDCFVGVSAGRVQASEFATTFSQSSVVANSTRIIYFKQSNSTGQLYYDPTGGGAIDRVLIANITTPLGTTFNGSNVFIA